MIKVDTSAEVVEQLASLLCDSFGFPADEGSPLREHSAATLRALLAERADLLAALEEARDALFFGAPVTVGLSNQIAAAIAAAGGTPCAG